MWTIQGRGCFSLKSDLWSWTFFFFLRPDLISLVFSDVGSLTPEGVSQYLVGMFAGWCKLSVWIWLARIDRHLLGRTWGWCWTLNVEGWLCWSLYVIWYDIQGHFLPAGKTIKFSHTRADPSWTRDSAEKKVTPDCNSVGENCKTVAKRMHEYSKKFIAWWLVPYRTEIVL